MTSRVGGASAGKATGAERVKGWGGSECGRRYGGRGRAGEGVRGGSERCDGDWMWARVW